MQIERDIATVTRTSAHRFHVLDGLRGIAALIVVARHSPSQLTALLPVFNSFLAVDFFFCLSGFVIAYSYEDRLRGRLGLRDFTVARIIRLYPMAFVGTLLGLAFMVVRGPLWASVNHGSLLLAVLLSLSILPNLALPYLGHDLFPFDDPAWSLFFEMLANVAYAGLIRWRIARGWVIGGISIGSLGALVLLGRIFHTIDGGVVFSTFAVGLARVGFSFFLGVLIFRLRRRSPQSGFRGGQGILMASLCAAALIAILTISTPITRSLPYEFLAVVLLLPAIVYLGSRVELPMEWTKACAFLGDLSYPLYILHHPLVAPLFIARVTGLANNYRVFKLFGLPIYIVVLAFLTWWLGQHVDVPIRKLLAAKYKALLAPKLGGAKG